MQSSCQSIGDNRQTPLAPLRDQGEVSPIPAQGWGAMGLVTLQLRKRQEAAIGQIPQLNTGSTALFADQGKQAAITADGRVLQIPIG